ncbi:MAG TPA: PQQ-binding-like beta-propeller repeat protein [Gemmatales bacterium]|nr:PQQ-binding-like beta-propeller repeat protein [Gemmatales bacterium]
MHRFLMSLNLFLLTTVLAGQEYDWPQWQGPTRDSKSPETGLLQAWPAGGPKLLYQLKGFGEGYSTPVIHKGIIYGMSWRGSPGSKEDGIWAYDEANQKELWFTPIGKADEKIGYNHGTRSSPTIDDDKIYGLTAQGDLGCLELATGKLLWKSEFKKQLGGKMMQSWGYSESVLVDGDLVIATPGGSTNTVVAFNKKTGSIVWRSAISNGGGAGYSSPVVMTVGGTKMYITWLEKCIVGGDAKTGRELWRNSKVAGGVANIPTPIDQGDLVFCTTGYNQSNGGSVLLKITKQGRSFQAKELWYLDNRSFMNHHGGVVLVDNHLYGGHGQNDGQLRCVNFTTGKLSYQARGVGSGSAAILYADGHLYYRYQDGTMALVKVNPAKAEVVSKFKLPYDSGKPSWPHPVICNGKLYIRDMDVIMVFDLKGT